MESIGALTKKSKPRPKKDPHLHGPNHLLAEELSTRLNDRKHFGFYLKMATLYDHGQLRALCGQVLEARDVKSPGKLFSFLIKKRNDENKNSTT
jgi:hypothetical protein